MTAEEEIAQLKKELAAERAKSTRLKGELTAGRAENAYLRQMLDKVLRRLGEVEGKLAKDSHNSSETRAIAFCRIRSYLSAMRKQGHSMLLALAAAFAARPLSIAWAPV
jgi:chromosome segregation ATPase